MVSQLQVVACSYMLIPVYAQGVSLPIPIYIPWKKSVDYECLQYLFTVFFRL